MLACKIGYFEHNKVCLYCVSRMETACQKGHVLVCERPQSLQSLFAGNRQCLFFFDAVRYRQSTMHLAQGSAVGIKRCVSSLATSPKPLMSASPGAMSALERKVCRLPGCTERARSTCVECPCEVPARYCKRNCQVLDWPMHRVEHRAAKSRAAQKPDADVMVSNCSTTCQFHPISPT